MKHPTTHSVHVHVYVSLNLRWANTYLCLCNCGLKFVCVETKVIKCIFQCILCHCCNVCVHLSIFNWHYVLLRERYEYIWILLNFFSLCFLLSALNPINLNIWTISVFVVYTVVQSVPLIHTFMHQRQLATMQIAGLTVWSNLGFGALPKDTDLWKELAFNQQCRLFDWSTIRYSTL